MHKNEKIPHSQIEVLKGKYLNVLNKNNLTIRFDGMTIFIRSSVFRVVLLVNLLILGSLISILFRSGSGPYWLPLIFLSTYFTYSIWNDTGSINTINIDLDKQTFRIYHLNFLRYHVLKLLVGYKGEYCFAEIGSFVLEEIYSYKAIYRKNYVKIQLVSGAEYIILDVPDKNQASTLANLLNETLRSTNYGDI